MRYLFFDIECADSVHMCEFGYVITDEQFNIIEKKDILINPEVKFNLIGRPNQKDLKLFYSEEEYYSSPIFPYYYEEIKNILEYQDQLIIGHAIINDAIFIKTACKKYKLDPINFKFSDSQKMYSEYFATKNSVSLEKAVDEFNVNLPLYLHKSDDDAELTMKFVKEILVSLDITLEEMLFLCPRVSGQSMNFSIGYYGNTLHDKLEMFSKNEKLLSKNEKNKCLLEFIKKIQLTDKFKSSKLNDKKICFGKEFEQEHLKDTLVLIKLLASFGCSYNTKVSENDYYVATLEEMELNEIDNHTRYYAAINKEDPNRHVEVISFDELFNILNISAEELKMMPLPKCDIKKSKNEKQRKKYHSTVKKSSASIGSILELDGVDLNSLCR